MKVNTRKLTLAICLLLISATLLGTASFAWFSMNTSVDVDGIEVEAYSDALFLQISNNNTDFATSTTFKTAKESLRLVSQIPVNTDALKVLTPTPATGAPDDSKEYYKKGEAKSSADTYAADNYILVDAFADATALDAYYRIEFVSIDEQSEIKTAVTGVTYCKPLDKGNGYEKVDVTYENVVAGTPAGSVYGLYATYSYTVTDDLKFVDGTTYYQLNETTRAFDAATVTPDEDIPTDEIYFEKVAGISPLGTGAGAYTDKDDELNIAYYTSPSTDKFVIANDLVPAEKVDGLYTLTPTDADAEEIAASSKVWWENGNGDYICVYENESTTDTADIKGKIFWGKTYSDTLGAVGAADMAAAEVGIIKDAAVANYVYKDTVYLRSALNTNDGKNLRIDNIVVGGRENAITNALSIDFVATNGAGEVKTVHYNNGVGFTAPIKLFDTILGDAKEVVSVDVYIYFDGTDASAKTLTTDAGEFNGQTVAIEFAINDVDYTINP